MIWFMDEADRILILGYRLNYDDNHINSIIRSEVNRGKKWFIYHLMMAKQII